MKFMQYLRTVSSSAPNGTANSFLHYKRLKQLLKRKSPQGVPYASDVFFRALRFELLRVNRNFNAEAKQLIGKSKRYAVKRRMKTVLCVYACSRLRMKFLKLGHHGQEQPVSCRERLLHRVEWCRQSATLNAMALRKICKKHDKLRNSNEGQEFLQACWQGSNSTYGSILHSPMLRELEAVARNLQRLGSRSKRSRDARASLDGPAGSPEVQMGEARGSAADVERGRAASAADIVSQETRRHPEVCDMMSNTTSGVEAIEGHQGSGQACDSPSYSQPPPVEDSLLCPICLSPFYKTVGLTCGHIYCAPCILTSIGLQYCLGTTRELLRMAPECAACPDCRQTNVFSNAVRLRVTDKLSKARYPEEWHARQSEEREHMQYIYRQQELGNPQGLLIISSRDTTDWCCFAPSQTSD